MKFRIEINETNGERTFVSKFQFKITIKQLLQSIFEEQRIENFTVEMGETTTFAEGLRQFLIAREIGE